MALSTVSRRTGKKRERARGEETLGARSVTTHLVLLYLLFEGDGPFLVLAPFVLEPHAYDARAQAGHLDQLFLHEGVRPRVGRVARPQRVQLLLVEHGPNARRLPVRRALARRTQPAAAVAGPVRPRPARTLVRSRFRRVCERNGHVTIVFASAPRLLSAPKPLPPTLPLPVTVTRGAERTDPSAIRARKQ